MGNEACFYKKMGWVAGDAVAADVIKADLVGLESGMKSEFDGNIDKCAGWSGSFGARRKREAGETDETDEEVSGVPSLMESGSSALSWLRSAVRKTRSAEPGKAKNNEENGNGKKGKGRRKGERKTSKGKKPKGKGKGAGRNKNSKKGKGRGKGKGAGKENDRKNGKGTPN